VKKLEFRSDHYQDLLRFRCDICDVLLSASSGPDLRPFVAFEFGCSEHSGNPAELFVMKPAAQCEYHLCHRCLAGLAALASECLLAELMATAIGEHAQSPTVAEPLASAGMFCCLCGGSFMGHSTPIVPVGSMGNAHASCVETARAAAAGANDARTYAARLAEARVNAVQETSQPERAK
jgi:hypothetical protein